MTNKEDQTAVDRKIKMRTWLSFIGFAIFIGVAILFWFKLKQQPKANGVQATLRNVLDKNETVFSKTYSKNNLVKEYSKDRAASIVRVNGDIGLKSKLDSNWKLRVIRASGDTLQVSLKEIKRLPKTSVIFDFKCIEGWSQISYWSGVRFGDFIKAYHLENAAKQKHIGLVTPDGKYYVGIDMESAMQPQTILAYEMNEKPLPMNQGYPLRLIIPVKYGIKSLKRIGTLSFHKERPKDYWFERGYDYYAGL